ncbi:LuxR C-terminal-related transcriptional regulator [Microbacterium sp. zg.Y1090]|nr:MULTISPECIES: LuxR C-terminal-related transcriptional regulator [unclassified Microbacterium]MCR2817240.1 LuxR C-terminal-related transcriptional regulator [Microbacterium sp. zg.Y1090]MDL5486092.1 LuxR C-terminal-related transcriptional regulator [Microbacterium sp. zg-Y1211]WIM29270.1 LuxR C-terminal-related transcriptional regulator [Microbacterium sp. zg-Y1090]
MAQTGFDTDDQLVARAVGDLSRHAGFPVVFAGLEHAGAVHVSAIAGARTRSIEGLVVLAGRGLGGASLVEGRPRLAPDYRTSRSITHDYDRAILGEGISTLLAVPIMVAAKARGVIYCGSWQRASVGDAVSKPVFAAAQSLAVELRVRDEVRRRVALIPPPESTATMPTAAREELRESYAELRSIAAAVGDPAIRERLARIEQRLATLSADSSPSEKVDAALSRREIDVLACCALGATNAEIAGSLGLKEGTVKSYLASAMAKLDASTRHAAVMRARRAGILP